VVEEWYKHAEEAVVAVSATGSRKDADGDIDNPAQRLAQNDVHLSMWTLVGSMMVHVGKDED
jgi:hypothetical protein